MMALLDNGQDLAKCEAEIGVLVGQLLTPLTRYRLRDPERPWAIDNGGFKNLDIPGLQSLLQREEHHRANCLFVAVPDIVGSAQRTLELFDHFAPMLEGWKAALVCQDGQENLPMAGLMVLAAGTPLRLGIALPIPRNPPRPTLRRMCDEAKFR